MPEQPNILLIVTEQHRGDCLGVEGHPVLMTPNIDNLALHGARFSRFYSACPTCISARRSILSGQLPQTHGMVGYAPAIDWNPTTLPQVLRDHGYQTSWVGRGMHLHPPRKRYGYEEVEMHTSPPYSDYVDWLEEHAPQGSGGYFGGGVMHNDWTVRPWHLDDYLHHTNWTVERALRFLRRRDPSRPFFLTLSFLGAHPPLQPPQFYFDRYVRTGVPEPVIGDWCTKPTGNALISPDYVSSGNVVLEGEAMLSARAAYYGLINHIDDQLRRIINPVTGLSPKNTVIVFTSDHGEMLGDHYLWRKTVTYEGSARIPFIIAGPENLGIEPGTIVDGVGTLADIMPTLLNIAAADIPGTVDGRDLLPMARKEADTVRDYLHIEHAPADHALTDGRSKYVWESRTGRERLFDLTNDPMEIRDLAKNEDRSEEVMRWRNLLIAELRDRPEGFTDGEHLVPGRPYSGLLPHGGEPTGGFSRMKWQ